MIIRPPDATRVAILYSEWKRTSLTSAWERLGALLADLVDELGGWSKVHNLCAEWLPQIPFRHIEMAFADHQLRSFQGVISK